MIETTDTITSRDLPHLRTVMFGYAANEVFGDDFRAVCQGVIAAIDQASDDDESTHTALKASLDAFVAAGNEEVQRCARIAELCHRIGDAEGPADFRDALIALIPLLPYRHLMEVSAVIAEALAVDGEMATDFDLVSLPYVSDCLH